MPAYGSATYRFRPFGLRALKREWFWHQLKRRHLATLAQVRAYQLERLRALLRHAAEHVPFYRERFRAIGLVPGDVRTLEDYARIPILTRDDVLAHLPEMWSRAFRQDRLLMLGTGGSTGVPMNYYKDLDYMDRSQVVLARSHAWAGRGRWDLLALFSSKHEPPGLWGEVRRRMRSLGERRLFFDAFGAGSDDLEQWLEILWRYRPRFAYGYPSFLEHFAKWLREHDRRLPPLKGLFVSAEILYPEQRALLGEVFGAPIFNLYGSREVQCIAAPCAAGGMHQIADWVLTEFVADEDLPSPRVVVTPLESYGMPLIRFANGDLGRAVEGPCVCGMAFPLMDLAVARVVDVFVTPEGKRFYGQFFTHLMYGISGVRKFQFHQVETDLIRLLVVKDVDFDAATEAKLWQAVAEVRAKVSAAIVVQIEYVDDIPRTAVGKHIFTRSDVWARRRSA